MLGTVVSSVSVLFVLSAGYVSGHPRQPDTWVQDDGLTGADIVPADRVSGLGPNFANQYTPPKYESTVVDLGAEFPDIPPPEVIAEPLREVVREGGDLFDFQYTRGEGHPRLVKALASLYGNKTHRRIDPYNEVVVTIGGTEAMFATIVTFVNPGDEVVLIEPFHDNYEQMVRLAGGIPVFVTMKVKLGRDGSVASDWTLDAAELESKICEKTKMIIVNNPHHPIGKVFTKKELLSVANVCKRNNVLVVMDEVYQWTVFNGKKHTRMNTLPGMWERTITIGSSDKGFSVTGLKIGHAYGPANLIKSIQLVHQTILSECPTPLQEAAAIAYENAHAVVIPGGGNYVDELTRELEDKSHWLARALQNTGIIPIIPDAGFCLLADTQELTRRAGLDDYSGPGPIEARVAKWLEVTHNIRGMPITAYFGEEHKEGAQGVIRLCFYKSDLTLSEAGDALRNLAHVRHHVDGGCCESTL